jgi:hypothetical protein
VPTRAENNESTNAKLAAALERATNGGDPYDPKEATERQKKGQKGKRSYGEPRPSHKAAKTKSHSGKWPACRVRGVLHFGTIRVHCCAGYFQKQSKNGCECVPFSTSPKHIKHTVLCRHHLHLPFAIGHLPYM